MATVQRLELSGPGRQLATGDLEGTWVRTDTAVRGIAWAVVERAGAGLQVRVAWVDGTVPSDQGTAPIDAVYAASSEGGAGVAFTARCDLLPVMLHLHANLSKGLLIIASMARSPEDPCGTFAREFFRKVEGQ